MRRRDLAAASALVVAALVGGCGRVATESEEPPSSTVRYATVALGDTCGQRGATTDAPVVLECVVGACARTHAGSGVTDGGGYLAQNAYGVCVSSCGPGGLGGGDAGRCPNGFDCLEQTVCRRPCGGDGDCPAPYQMCAKDGYCDVVGCTADADCISAGARCTDGVCTR